MKSEPVEISIGIKGRYKITVIRPDGSNRLETPWFDNLVLDQGLNRLGTSGVILACQVGSGNTPPTVADTSLQSRIGGTNGQTPATNGINATAPYYGWQRWTFRFAPGQATGNISEVGVGWSDSSTGSLFSRALIRDVNGDPITITVLADETLDVSYELRSYVPTEDVPFSISMADVIYAGICRPASVPTGAYWNQVGLLGGYGVTFSGGASNPTVYNGSIGPITGAPFGSQRGMSSTSLYPYENNSKERSALLSAGLDSGNVANGITAFTIDWYGMGSYQASFSPAIPKTNQKVMTLVFKISWSRKTLP